MEDEAVGDLGDEGRVVTARMTAPEAADPGVGFEQELAVGRVLGGRYEVTDHVGAGGMGIVYAARDRLLEMRVALKFVRPDQARHAQEKSRLWKEVRLAQRITHPNVVRTFTLERQEGHLFIVMELLDGCSLAARLREGPLPVAEAVRITRGILTGLAAAHALEIIHRDIKPENTRVCSDGRVVLMDFGIARAYHVEPATAEPHGGDRGGSHTILAGTAGYIAPEVAAGARATAASDLYAVGVVMQEMLVGRRFAARATVAPVANGGATVALEPTAALPAGLAGVLARMLEQEPTQRFRSAQEVLDALDALERPPAAARRRRWPAIVAVGALAAAAIVLVAIVARNRNAPPTMVAPTFAALIDPARRWWPHSTIPICWEADKVGDELSWIQEAARGPGSWPSHVGVDLVGWRECGPASSGIRITAGAMMMAHTGVGRPPDGVAHIEIDVGVAPERRWARCIAARLDRESCIKAETLHLIGLVLGFSTEPDRSPGPSCPASAVGPTTASNTRSIVAHCGAASILQPLDLAAAQAVYGVKDDVDRGNLALVRDEQRRPHLVAFLIDTAGHLHLAKANASRDRWQWTAAGGPVGWSGRFSVISVRGDHGRWGMRGFGIASGWLHEYDATGAIPVWQDRGGPGDLIGSPTAVTYIDPGGRSRVHVFATSAGGRLYEYSDTGTGASWHDRGSAGLIGSPTAVSHLDDDGRRIIDTFVRDDRASLHQLRLVEQAPTWIDRTHENREALVTHVGSPSVTEYLNQNGGRHGIVEILDEKGGVWNLWTGGGDKWRWDPHGGPGNLVGSTSYVRTANEDGSSRFNIFAVGTDGRLHQEAALPKWHFLVEAGPSNLIPSPAAFLYYDADETSRTDVVVVDAEGRGQHLAWTPSTKRWTAMGGPRLAPIQR